MKLKSYILSKTNVYFKNDAASVISGSSRNGRISLWNKLLVNKKTKIPK